MENLSELNHVVTPEIQISIVEKDSLFNGVTKYMDADEEMIELSKHIVENTLHNCDIEPERIKFLYTTKPKKDGIKYVTGHLVARSEIERMVNDEFDYVIIIFYKVWKALDMENKIIQLDKLLCGVTVEEAKKYNVDSKEYIANMKHYGTEKVLEATEAVDIAINSILDKEKDERKQMKEKSKEFDMDKIEEIK